MKETELYEPVKELFEGLGFSVSAEVGSHDVLASRDKHLIIIELKLRICLDLVYQGIIAQERADDVYFALPVEGSGNPKGSIKRFKKLMSRLGIGLIYIRFMKTGARAEIVQDPGTGQIRKQKRMRTRLRNEVKRRYLDDETGGTSGRTKKLTAYRQECIHIAYLLNRLGPTSPKELRKHGAPYKCGPILYQNHYAWFDHPEKGVYALNKAGEKALHEYKHLLPRFETLLPAEAIAVEA